MVYVDRVLGPYLEFAAFGCQECQALELFVSILGPGNFVDRIIWDARAISNMFPTVTI